MRGVVVGVVGVRPFRVHPHLRCGDWTRAPPARLLAPLLSLSHKHTKQTQPQHHTHNTNNTGTILTTSETVRKLGFTGSTQVGKRLAAQAAATAKRLSLELGGNAPFLVFPDADLELAARGVVASALRNAGQTCICVNRAFVHESVADEFAALVAQKAKALRAGDGAAAETQLGPLISRAAVDKVAAHVADAVGKGARVVAGGAGMVPEGLPESLAKGGNWHAATVLDHATIDMLSFCCFFRGGGFYSSRVFFSGRGGKWRQGEPTAPPPTRTAAVPAACLPSTLTHTRAPTTPTQHTTTTTPPNDNKRQALLPRRDVRPPDPHLPLLHGGRGRRPRQRHRVRPRRLLLHARPRARVARGGEARVRHGRGE